MVEPSPRVIALVRDLVFASKITAAARAAGIEARIIRDPAAFPAAAGQRVFVDLSEPGAIDAAVQWKAVHRGEVIGFVSHVDVATAKQAHDAGIDRVLSRSQFTAQLDQFLPR